MEDEFSRKIIIAIILAILIILTFFILKPILSSIIVGFILAYIFSPVYDWIYKRIKSKNLTASFICAFLILLILIPFWFLTPIVINQSVKLYLAAQQADIVTPLKTLFPSFFSSDQFSSEVAAIIQSFIKKITDYLVNSFSDLVLNFPTLFLKSLIVFFTLFFVLRDKDEMIVYLKEILPFSKEVEKKLFDYSKGITSSVLYGYIIVGTIQGLIVGIGFFIFQVPNSLLLTLLAILLGILPFLGPPLIYIPVIIYLLVAGNNFAAIGILVLGIISTIIDSPLRSLIVSKKVKLHSSITLIGMIGGLLFFGILGLILGPLILSYLLVILEIYRNRNNK